MSSLFTLVLDWNNPNSEKDSRSGETDLPLESSLINTEAVRVYTAGVHTCRYRQRQDEPLPPREAQVQQILYPQEIIRLSRFCILLIYGHIRFYIYFTINTVMVVSSEANDNQKEVDRTLFPLTVDCLALTELGST